MGHARLGNHPASVCGRGGGSARAPSPCDSLSPLPITRSSAEIDAPPPPDRPQPALSPRTPARQPRGRPARRRLGDPRGPWAGCQGARLCPAFPCRLRRDGWFLQPQGRCGQSRAPGRTRAPEFPQGTTPPLPDPPRLDPGSGRRAAGIAQLWPAARSSAAGRGVWRSVPGRRRQGWTDRALGSQGALSPTRLGGGGGGLASPRVESPPELATGNGGGGGTRPRVPKQSTVCAARKGTEETANS